MNIVGGIGIIVVIVILCIIYMRKKAVTDLKQENSIGDSTLETVEDDLDVATEMLEKHKTEVSVFSENMRLWENTKVLYKWSDIACIIRNNPFSLKFNQGTCPKCSSSLIMVEYSERVGEIFICKECKTQFDRNSNELITDNPTAVKQKSDLINLHIAEGEELSADLKNTLAELNPRAISILNAISELNCSISIKNSAYMEFVYNDKTFIVWLDEENILHYPNWLCIDKSNFTQDIIHKIQVSNQNSLSCTYWLFDGCAVVNKCYYLSSNINIYDYANKLIVSSVLKECLDRLIYEADKTVQSFSTPIECKSINYNINLDALEELLRGADCQDVNRDEDGDINFKFNECNMYIKILDSNHIRVFWHCKEFNEISKNGDVSGEDVPDMLALFIQWSNLGYPYKYTYYKPTSTKHSLTAYLNFDLNFIMNTAPQYIKDSLSEFVNFIYNTDITDEDYFFPIQNIHLSVIDEVKNLTSRAKA